MFLGAVGILVALLGLVARTALSSGNTKTGPPAGAKKTASTSKAKKSKE